MRKNTLELSFRKIFFSREDRVSKDILFDIGKSKNLSREQLKEYIIQYLNEEIDRKVRWETEDEKRKLEGEILKVTDKNRELPSAYYNNTEGRLKPDSIDLDTLIIICKNISNFFKDDQYIQDIFDGDLNKNLNEAIFMTCKKIGADKTYKKEGIENPLILSTQKLLMSNIRRREGKELE